MNNDDAFDVHCQTEDSTGTRMRQQTCRPQFVNDISTDAAEAWVNGLEDACGAEGVTQACMFDNPGMQRRFAAELARVVRDHPELQQALLDYEAVERAYAEARDGRRGRARAASR